MLLQQPAMTALLLLVLGWGVAAQAFVVVPSGGLPGRQRGGGCGVRLLPAAGSAGAIRGRGMTLFMASKPAAEKERPAAKSKAPGKFDPLALTGAKPSALAAGGKGEKAGGEAVEGEGAKGEEGSLLVYKGMLLIVAMLWGSNFGALKYLDTCGVDISLLTAMRFLLASVALLPALWGKGFGVLKAGMEVGLWVTLGYITQAIGLETTEVR